MPLAELPVSPRSRRVVQQLLQQGRLVSSYLLHGPVGADLEPLGYGIAKALFCPSCEHDFCDACAVCRRIDKNMFADLLVVHPEDQKIKIEVVRETITPTAMSAPYESDTRAILIVDAELMNLNAANALLKVLEEPPPHVHFFLLTHHRERLLPTIRSRCQQLAVGILGVDGVAEQLAQQHNLPPDQAAELARRSGGRLSHALALHEDADIAELYDRALEALQLARTGHIPELLQVLGKRGPGNRERVLAFLAAVEQLLHDALVHASGGDAALLYYRDDPTGNTLAELFANAPADEVAGLLEEVWSAMRDLRGNANPAIRLSDLLLALAPAGANS